MRAPNETRRRPIPALIKQQVLIEAGYRCAVPTCRTVIPLDLHHITRVADDGSDEADNLLALCPNCHARHHRGDIPAEALKVYKGLLVSLNEGLGREAKDALLFFSLEQPSFFAISADQVLKLSPLIVSGLLSVNPATFNGQIVSPPHYRVELTEKGAAVVDAWKAGDASALALAQSLPA